ncbi:MAG: SPASM domain-containing protein [Deltaproteobacteria bacterium]|nr:SPASM domain-containing protein [Deltaproteobacteria bacterium]
MPIQGTPAARPGHPDSVVADWSVDPDDWGTFLCRTFELWLKTGLGKVLVNWFESSVGAWMNEPAQMCNLAPVCGKVACCFGRRTAASTRANGSSTPEYRLGNLLDPGCQLGDVVYSDRQRRFGLNKRDSLTDQCKRCPYLFACHGECPKNRFIKSLDGQPAQLPLFRHEAFLHLCRSVSPPDRLAKCCATERRSLPERASRRWYAPELPPNSLPG